MVSHLLLMLLLCVEARPKATRERAIAAGATGYKDDSQVCQSGVVGRVRQPWLALSLRRTMSEIEPLGAPTWTRICCPRECAASSRSCCTAAEVLRNRTVCWAHQHSARVILTARGPWSTYCPQPPAPECKAQRDFMSLVVTNATMRQAYYKEELDRVWNAGACAPSVTTPVDAPAAFHWSGRLVGGWLLPACRCR